VKVGLSRTRARLLPNDVAGDLIRQAARKAVEKEARPPAFRPLLPMEVKIEFTRSDHCDDAAGKHGVERIDARTARKISNETLDFWF